MESASLTQAHEHVRTAATATLDKSVATAGQEHDLAAAAFGQAARDTHNAEALRILALLEDHHRNLAGLIKEAPRKDKKPPVASHAADSSATSPLSDPSTARTPLSPSSPTPHTSRRRLPQSSIASNLAEKRGIPSARRTSSATAVNVAGATASRTEPPSTPVRDLLAQQSRKADLAKANHLSNKQQHQQQNQQPSSPAAEDNFRRFYSAFGGLISAISAPLAFTSLPLNPLAPTPVPEPTKEEKPQKTKSRAQSPEASRSVKSSVPDLAALISKPALRALRKDGAPPLGPNESFYLVPTSGGTVTYASVLRDPNTPNAPQLDPINEGSGFLKGSSHEEFVDARESPPSPTSARRPRSRGQTASNVTAPRTIAAGRGAGLRTMEELALENETLKNLVDSQAKRIQMWETNSQNSFNALAQSFRARGPGRLSSDPSALAQALSQGSGAVPAFPSPPLPSQPTSPRTDTDQARRIADLEAMLANQTAKVNDLMTNNEQLAKKNERDGQVLRRYREQWEKLKAGARKKEQERRERKAVEGNVSGTATIIAAAAETSTKNNNENENRNQDASMAAAEVDDEEDLGTTEADFGKA